jgi:hypothetical protein
MDGELARTTFHPLRLHRIYRLRLQRDGNRVRLITKGGYNWTDRYPWIVEAARKVRQSRFVIDSEAVVLGVDMASPISMRCIPANTMTRCSFTPSTSGHVEASGDDPAKPQGKDRADRPTSPSPERQCKLFPGKG